MYFIKYLIYLNVSHHKISPLGAFYLAYFIEQEDADSAEHLQQKHLARQPNGELLVGKRCEIFGVIFETKFIGYIE